MTGLRRGAIVFLDVLGFKGIWNRVPPGDVLGKMRRLADSLAARIAPGVPYALRPKKAAKPYLWTVLPNAVLVR
jgi:hypothetical protein